MGHDLRPVRAPPSGRCAAARWRALHQRCVPRRGRGDPRPDRPDLHPQGAAAHRQRVGRDGILRLVDRRRAPGQARRGAAACPQRNGRLMDARERAMRRAAELGLEYLAGLGERHVGALSDDVSLARQLGGPLPEEGEDPERVVEAMAQAFDPGFVASAGPRYFGFVIGGQLPAAAGADWLTGAWSQAANLHPLSPAAAAAELVAGPWMLDLLGLPADASFG